MELSVGRLRITAAPEEAPPFDPEAVVFEEDTYLVLSADPVAREPEEHPLEILTRVHELEPEPPGTVLVREGRPVRLLAVVHDLSRDPTWTEQWIGTALEGVFTASASRGFESLALPPLGCKHGRLGTKRFAALLARALGEAAPASLSRLWLVVSSGDCAPMLGQLREALAGGEH